MFIYSVKVQGHSYSWARLVYQFIKLYTEVYTFPMSHDYPYTWGGQSPKHIQGEQAGFTMKPFKGSSNKLGPLDSLSKQI
jgi:hypothetical protein